MKSRMRPLPGVLAGAPHCRQDGFVALDIELAFEVEMPIPVAQRGCRRIAAPDFLIEVGDRSRPIMIDSELVDHRFAPIRHSVSVSVASIWSPEFEFVNPGFVDKPWIGNGFDR